MKHQYLDRASSVNSSVGKCSEWRPIDICNLQRIVKLHVAVYVGWLVVHVEPADQGDDGFHRLLGTVAVLGVHRMQVAGPLESIADIAPVDSKTHGGHPMDDTDQILRQRSTSARAGNSAQKSPRCRITEGAHVAIVCGQIARKYYQAKR